MDWHELDNVPIHHYSRVFKERTRDWWMWILRDKLYLRNGKNIIGFQWKEWDMFMMYQQYDQYEMVDDKLIFDIEKEVYYHFDPEIIQSLWSRTTT